MRALRGSPFYSALVEYYIKEKYMVKFKCKHTGNISEFNTEHDIKTMREHAEYAEVLEEVKETPKPKSVKKSIDDSYPHN